MSTRVGPSDESFLPQIIGLFYAVFDPQRGSIIPYQVPETLISSTANNGITSSHAPSSYQGGPLRGVSGSTVDGKAVPDLLWMGPTERDTMVMTSPTSGNMETSNSSLASLESRRSSAGEVLGNSRSDLGTDPDKRTISHDFATSHRPPPSGKSSPSPPPQQPLPRTERGRNGHLSNQTSISDLGTVRRQPSDSPTRASVRERIIAESRPGSRGSSIRSPSPLGAQPPGYPPFPNIPSNLSYQHRGSYSSTVTNSAPVHLLDFAHISEYVIPKAQLKHKLVTCSCISTTWAAWSNKEVAGRTGQEVGSPKEFTVLGFPCILEDEKYERNEFRWNMAFVFDGNADLSAFEPVVRKCGRILRAAELDTRFLSSSESKNNIQSILEQIYEDLNSYSETSISIDGINFLELKLFPFYPNPPPVEDWQVAVPLFDLVKIKDPNWDLTAAKVAPFINGVHHVARIADLADADLECTRLCIQHFLYYQVIMMIDIFQFSNMYTVKPVIQRITRDQNIVDECGPYVTRDTFEVSSWPVLLELYTRLRPGITVQKWMQDNQVQERGIDVRRFITFGVIKGFLRRVHRWPIHLDLMARGQKGSALRTALGQSSNSHSDNTPDGQSTPTLVHRESHLSSMGSRKIQNDKESSNGSGIRFQGEPGESSLTIRSGQSTDSLPSSANGSGMWKTLSTSPYHSSHLNRNSGFANELHNSSGIVQPLSSTSHRSGGSHRGSVTLMSSSSVVSHPSLKPTSGSLSGRPGSSSQNRLDVFNSRLPLTARGTRLRQSQKSMQSHAIQEAILLDEIRAYCDGSHHTDEIQVRFKMSWARLEMHLQKIAGLPFGIDGKLATDEMTEQVKADSARGDYGKVVVVIR